jgi:hypothetical protein
MAECRRRSVHGEAVVFVMYAQRCIILVFCRMFIVIAVYGDGAVAVNLASAVVAIDRSGGGLRLQQRSCSGERMREHAIACGAGVCCEQQSPAQHTRDETTKPEIPATAQ